MPTVLDATDVGRLERALYDAMIADDTAELDRLLSEDLRYIHSSANMQSKQEYMKAQKDRYDYAEIDSFDPVYHLFDGVAIVSNRVHMLHRVDGKPEKLTRSRVVYIWREEPAGWRLFFRQSAHIPDPG